jgi:hypothetical protein
MMFGPQAQAVAQRVFEIVAEFRHSPIDNEHILLALLESSDEEKYKTILWKILTAGFHG